LRGVNKGSALVCGQIEALAVRRKKGVIQTHLHRIHENCLSFQGLAPKKAGIRLKRLGYPL
jgi:hypothetical protein